MDIKEEFPFSEVISQTNRESSSQGIATMFNSGTTVCNKLHDTEIKEEGVDSDFSPQNDWLRLPKDPVIKVKQCQDYEIEIKTEVNEEIVDSEFCPQNERQFFSEHPVMTFDPCSKDSELDTKIEIKEEMWWLERTSTEAPCVNEATKDCLNESVPSTESIRSYNEDTSRDKTNLLLDENPDNNARFSITQDSIECRTARKYTSKKIVLPEISSAQKSSYSEHDSAQKYDFVQQESIQVHELNKEYYFNESGLVRNTIHQFNHEGKKSHLCDTCGKCFTRSTNLKVHKLNHEGIKPHLCDTCGKSFTQSSNLKQHKLIHEGIKVHQCETCGKCFTLLATLKTHKLTHEGIKPHKCETCGKCFTHSTALKTHKLTHEGIKPHKCDTCGKCFTQLTSLKTHKWTHKGKKSHQ